MTLVKQWVRDLVEKELGGSPLEVGKRYKHPEDGPVTILRGQYWGTNGLSNFWYWKVERTGKTNYGYGGTWPEITDELIDTD